MKNARKVKDNEKTVCYKKLAALTGKLSSREEKSLRKELELRIMWGLEVFKSLRNMHEIRWITK